MAVGYEVQKENPTIFEDIPTTVNQKIVKILLSIFRPSEGEAPATLKSIAANSFFSSVQLYSEWNPEPVSYHNHLKNSKSMNSYCLKLLFDRSMLLPWVKKS